MRPTLPEGSYILTSCVLPHQRLHRGDLIVFRRAGTFYVKRLIGLPGDRVGLLGGVPVLNGVRWRQGAPTGAAMTETNGDAFTYLITLPDASAANESMDPIIVAPGRVFVLGDNRDNSWDSRQQDLGQIPLDDVVSRAVLLLQWRPDDAGPTLSWIARP